MKTYTETMQDHTDTIKSCGQAFYAVCDCVMTKEQMKQWTTRAVLPDDFMDANMTLHDILINHNIEVFNEDGEITSEGEVIMEEAWKFADALNKKKNTDTIAVVEAIYTLEDLFQSVTDIFAQYDEGKIEHAQAKELAKKCCNEFLKGE